MPKYLPTPESEERLLTKTRYSPSRMLTYMKCGAFYEFRYLSPQVEEMKPVNLFLGSVVHKIAEMAYEHKIQTGVLPHIDDLLAAHEEIWRDAGEEVVEDEVGDLLKSQQMSRKMLQVYLKDRAPNVDPIETEAEWYLEFPHKDFYIHGIIDLVAAYKPLAPITFTDTKGTAYDDKSLHHILTTEADSPLANEINESGFVYHGHSDEVRVKRIHDIKTIARTPAMDLMKPGNYQMSPDYEFQLAFYATMITEGRHDLSVCLDYITKQATPKVMEASSLIEAKRVPLMLNTIDLIHRSAETKLFYPNRASKFCGSNCEFWDACHEKHG